MNIGGGMKIMKAIFGVLAVTALCFASVAQASSCGNKLCVPGDFPSPDGADFNMDLLSGSVHVDFGDLGGADSGLGGFTLNNFQPIGFHASPFSNGTDTSAGTSTLTYESINHYLIGSALIFGSTADFYLDGTGTGTLVDIDGTTGDWSLSIPLFATWANTLFNFGQVVLSTAQTYSYYGETYLNTDGDPVIDRLMHSISGQSMDYASGNAFLVGQAEINDPEFLLNGVRVTFGIYGNDPVVSSVPEPAVIWSMLFGLGLLGVAVRHRRRNLST
jgi:hypothetical protein